MTSQRPDSDKPLFADMDEPDGPDATRQPTEEQPIPIGADPMGVNPGAGAAIPLGAPSTGDAPDAQREEPDPRGR